MVDSNIAEEKYEQFALNIHDGHVRYLQKDINRFGEYKTMLQEAIKHNDYETVAFMTARQIAVENPSSKLSENEYIYFNIPGKDEIAKYANMYKKGEQIDVRVCQAVEETYFTSGKNGNPIKNKTIANPDIGNEGEIIPVARINFGYIHDIKFGKYSESLSTEDVLQKVSVLKSEGTGINESKARIEAQRQSEIAEQKDSQGPVL